MRKEDILAYVHRDWKGNEKRKRRWKAEASRMTPVELLAIGDMLRNHALDLHPDWPTEHQRREDLAAHIRVSVSNRPELAELLRAVAAAMVEQGRRWYLFGAHAALIWGSQRYSKDADITVRIALDEIADHAPPRVRLPRRS